TNKTKIQLDLPLITEGLITRFKSTKRERAKIDKGLTNGKNSPWVGKALSSILDAQRSRETGQREAYYKPDFFWGILLQPALNFSYSLSIIGNIVTNSHVTPSWREIVSLTVCFVVYKRLVIKTSNTLHNAIMEAGGKDRPPMLAPGNYVQWKSRIKRYIDTKPNHELIHYCLKNPLYKYTWAEKGESINVQDLETNVYWEFRKFTSRDGESLESYYSRFYKMMNELVMNQCDVTNHQVNVQFLLQLQPEWQRSQQAATRNRGKAIVNSPTPIYDQEPFMVTKDDEMSKDKKIDKRMALISLSFKKIYKPTNNNLRTSSNTSRANQDNSLRINRGAGERQKPKRVKDAAYHKEKMLLCKQEEAGIQLKAEQADWRDDTDDESKYQKLEAHYMHMVQIQEVTPDVAADSRPIFDSEPLQNVSNDDNYNVFAIESEHPKQSKSVHDTYPIEQDEHNVIIDSLDMNYDREHLDQDDDDDLANKRELLASLIEKLKYETDDSKNRNKFLEASNKVLVEKLKGEIEDFKTKNKSLESSNNRFKEVNNKLSETNALMYNDLKKFQAELDRRNDVKYASKMEIDCAKAKGDLMSYKMESQNDSLKSQLETQKTQFLNEIDRLSKEYYYADHMNAILGVCTELDEDLKAQLQDKGIALSELKKLIEKLKGKSLDTKLEKSSVIRQPDAFKSQRPSLLGKPTIFSDSLERKDFSKSKSVTKNNVSNEFSKLVTTQILPPNKKSILKNTNVLASGMYKLHTKPTQTRTTQLPQDSRKTNKHMSFSTGVIPTTSVSRPQLKSNQMEDRVMLNNSQGKKQEVEDHRRNVKFSKNKTSVTACNDSLNAKTLNVNFVCTTCGKCVLNAKHDTCVLKSRNGVNSRTKMPLDVLVSTREPKRTVKQSVTKPFRKTVASESTNQKPRNTTRKLYEHVTKTCSWWYPKFTPPGYNWKPKSEIGNVNPNVSMPLGNASRTANILEHMTPRHSTVSNTTLYSNSFVARRDYPCNAPLRKEDHYILIMAFHQSIFKKA
nr:hypothetical protein [Tanacetum cinerariifolium]